MMLALCRQPGMSKMPPDMTASLSQSLPNRATIMALIELRIATSKQLSKVNTSCDRLRLRRYRVIDFLVSPPHAVRYLCKRSDDIIV